MKFPGIDSLKKKANELWETIVHLETEKYDLEERSKRQDYDVSPFFFFFYYMILHLRKEKQDQNKNTSSRYRT